MSKQAWTPGPWRRAKKYPRQICDRRGFKIAKCLMKTKGANFEISEEEALANAHLIEAAPDLYEALVPALSEIQETLDYLIEHAPKSGSWDGDIRKLKRLIKTASAALAKARGEGQ